MVAKKQEEMERCEVVKELKWQECVKLVAKKVDFYFLWEIVKGTDGRPSREVEMENKKKKLFNGFVENANSCWKLLLEIVVGGCWSLL